MATYPCIYVYDAPGINPAAFGSYGAGIYIPKLGLVPKHVRPVRPVANLYDLLASWLFWRGGAWSGVPGVGARCGNGLFSTYKSPKILS